MIPTGIKYVKEKYVKVTDIGPILPMGNLYGPTLPRIMNTHMISVLLQKGYHVTEILNDGTEVKLTLMNYDRDLNNGITPKVTKRNDNIREFNGVESVINTKEEKKEKDVLENEIRNNNINNNSGSKYVKKKKETVVITNEKEEKTENILEKNQEEIS